MAVYTHVSRQDLDALLRQYDIGAATSFQGIAQGVENTNYALTTDHGRFILTLFERRVCEEDLPYFLALTTHLSRKGIPAPAPVAAKTGALVARVCDRPAVIVTFLDGSVEMTPGPAECGAAGGFLAGLHVAVRDFPHCRANTLGPDGWRDLRARCGADADRCAPGLSRLLDGELALIGTNWPDGLPAGAVHADLFPDNLFFKNHAVSGVIDFYFACTDYFAYDLAICLASWCWLDGRWRAENAAAMLSGYEGRRRLGAEERSNLSLLLRGASTRFLLTRLYDWLNQVRGAVVAVKDPLEYRDLLLFLRDASPESLYGPRV